MIECSLVYYVLFFKQKTADEMRISDWSSDVCSSDLVFRKVLTLGETVRPGSRPQEDGNVERVVQGHDACRGNRGPQCAHRIGSSDAPCGSKAAIDRKSVV